MSSPIPNLFKVPELKDKLLFTLLCLVVYRIGAHIATPGVTVDALADAVDACVAGGEEHGEELVLANRLMQRRNQMFLGDGASFEEFFHEPVIALGDQLHQLLVRALRRVLQVGHELQHIDQYRAGLIGPAHKAKREFLAHYWTAVAPEPPGTGCVNSATRVAIIDCALAFCHCMTAVERAPYAEHERRLLQLRGQLQPRNPWPPTAGMPSCPPPNC